MAARAGRAHARARGEAPRADRVDRPPAAGVSERPAPVAASCRRSEKSAVELDVCAGDRRPAELLDRPRPAGRAERDGPSGSASSSLTRSAMPRANAAGSTGSPEPSSRGSNGTSRPVTPSSTTSGMPPVRVATTARLAGHRLEVDDPERLVDRRADEHRRVAEQLDQVGPRAASPRSRAPGAARRAGARRAPRSRPPSSGVSGAPAQSTSWARRVELARPRRAGGRGPSAG